MRISAKELDMQVERLRVCAHAQTGAERLRYDRQFARLLAMLQPRIRHLIRAYGLADLAEDAQQACAIGVYRALESYDPAQARFSTHVTWQLRGELQGLRHRMRLDQRRSARTAGIRTVSLDAVIGDGSDAVAAQFEDEMALPAVERCASDMLALRLVDGLMDRIGSPAGERRIIYEALFDDAGDDRFTARQREQRRQVVRRTWRNCAKVLAAGSPMAA